MSSLYVTIQGSSVGIAGNVVCVTKQGEVLLEYPLSRIDKVVIIGRAQISAYAVNYFLDNKVNVFFLSKSGKYRGMLTPGNSSSIFVRAAQYKRAENSQFLLKVARRIVSGKLKNSLAVGKNLTRSGKFECKPDFNGLEKIIHSIPDTASVEVLRGLEGSGARAHYAILSKLVPKPFVFKGRNRRPPADPVNVLLSLGYTLLLNSVLSSIMIVSLDPYMGFLHSDKRGAPALALDLMEEWRPLVDYWVIQSLRCKIFSVDDFSNGDGRVIFSREGIKRFFEIFETKILSEILHPEFNETTTILRCMELQATLFRQFILDQNRDYVPFRIKG